jgi:uncharacterized protein
MDRVRHRYVFGACMLLLAGLAAAEVLQERNSVDQLKAMTDSQFKATITSAQKGNISSQTLLGIAYMQGVRVAKDETAAVEWFRRAAKKGNPIAENNLGLLYFHGRGTAQNFAEAAKWFHRAGEDGSSNALFNLALMFHHGYGMPANLEEAAKWYEVAAIEGDGAAQNTLGFLYEKGSGVAQDLVAAEKWYRKAAEQGSAMAQYNLGLFYLSQTKHQDAYGWFVRAARQGHIMAAHYAAELNLHGHCMDVNYGEAYHWLIVSQQKDDWSLRAMAVCKEHLSDKDVEQMQAVAKVGTP